MKIQSIVFIILLILPSYLFSQSEPIKLEGPTQGSSFHISYFDKDNRNLRTEIVELLHQFDLSVSTYDSTSIIAKINAGKPNIKVDTYFKDCFKKAIEVSIATDGAFDATVFPLVNAWGFGPQKKLKVDKRIIDSILVFVGYQKIKLEGDYIVKRDPRVSLDFNSFAPGYSVDVVSKFLETKGITSYVVEIGGEVFAKGKKPNGDNWKVGIEKPIDNVDDNENPLKAIIKLENMAVATSGNNRKFFIEDGKRYAHHIDPRTGYPTKNNLLSASVFSSSCVNSDAYATGLLVMGLDKSIEFLNNHKFLQAYLIYSDDNNKFRVYESEGLKAIISEAKE